MITKEKYFEGQAVYLFVDNNPHFEIRKYYISRIPSHKIDGEVCYDIINDLTGVDNIKHSDLLTQEEILLKVNSSI